VTRVALISYFFPPAATVQRPVKLAGGLAARGVAAYVIAPNDPKWIQGEDHFEIPPNVAVHRVRYVGPKARRIADDLYGTSGRHRAVAHLRHVLPRLLVPDEVILWALTAVPAAVRFVRRNGIDVVVTSSSPSSVHVIGAAVKRATGVAWIADVRDSLDANPHRRGDGPLQRVKLESHRAVARLVAEQADGIVAATAGIAAELRSRGPSAPVTLIRNGCDFDDFAGLEYTPGKRFRLTHTGSFYGARDPRPVLDALARSASDVVLRFVGDFRPRDLAYAVERSLANRLELHGHVAHRRALELQRDSEALLLLVPDADSRGRSVVPAKLYEYLAAGRPIIAAVPPDGEAAAILRETNAGMVVDPRDVRGIAAALAEMVDRFEDRRLDDVPLAPALVDHLSRAARAAELHAVVTSVASGSAPGRVETQPAATTTIKNA
jgi:glycosyltransferase involved in cell wall biosynthesis